MRPQHFTLQVILGLLTLFAPFVMPQASDELPQCWQDCLSHHDGSCKIAGSSCFCHLAGGKFLTEVVMCLVNNCNDRRHDPNPQVFITGSRNACRWTEFPIPSAVISSAELIIETASAISDDFTSTAVGIATDPAGQVHSINAPTTHHNTRSSTSQSPSTSSQSGGTIITSLSTSLTATIATNIVTATSSPTSSETPAASPATTKKSSGGDGTILDIQNIALKRKAGSLLSLTIGILAGMMWF